MAESLNDQLRDLELRHSVGLQRLSTTVVRKVIKLLDAADHDIVAQLLKRGATLQGSLTSQRLKFLLDALRIINRDAYARIERELVKDLQEVATYESDFQTRLITNTVPVGIDLISPTAPMLKAIVTTRPFQGALLRDVVRGMEKTKLTLLSNAIRLGMVEGESMEAIVRRVRGTKAANFKDGIMQAPRASAERVVRTAVNHVANAAREELIAENDDLIKGVQWVATLDTRTCPSCAALDGKVFGKKSGPRPPRHLNCFPGDTLVTARQGVTSVSKRWYDGQLSIIRTASGKELASTPNHPILTDRGWVAAHLLKVGGNVVCDGGHEWKPLTVDVDHEDMPSRIEDVAETAFRSRQMFTRPVPTATEDFHGDGMDGEIAVIATDRLLADGNEATVAKQAGKSLFVARNMSLITLACKRAFEHAAFRLRCSTRGIMGGGNLLSAFLTGHRRPLKAFSFAGVASGDIFTAEHSSNYTAGNAVSVSERFLGRSCEICGNDLVDRHADRFSRPIDANRNEPAIDDISRDAKLATDIANGRAGPVFLDRIVQTESVSFSGHVFNLETPQSVYTAEGIITHNCRCATVPVMKSWRELGIDADEVPPSTRASMNGAVSATETFGTWLRKQSAATQDEALGATRGALFRRGGLEVDRFVDVRGNDWSLDELRARESAAFEKAGIAA